MQNTKEVRMLKSLRKKSIIKITMWFLVATLVIWGVGSVATTSKNYAGIIFGKKISTQDFARNYNSVLTRAKMLYGDDFAKMQQLLNIQQQTWDRIILLYYAKKNRINATDKEVVAKIASMPFFQSEGSFDQKTYQYIVETVFATSTRDFEESIRQDIIINKLLERINKDVSLTDEEILKEYNKKNEKADINYIIVDKDLFKNNVFADENEIQQYYSSNKELFLTPDKINVYYVKIPFDETSESKYNAKETAYELNNDLFDSKNINISAKKYNLDVYETTPFAFGESVSGVGLSYPFLLSAFSLNEQNNNTIVEEKDAFYVMQLKEKMPPYVPEFTIIQQQVKDNLISKKCFNEAEKKATQYFQMLQDGNITLKTAAQQLGVEIRNAKNITRQSNLEGVGINENLLDEVFSADKNKFAKPVKIAKGFIIAQLDKIIPIDKEKFKKEKNVFSENLLKEKQKAAFNEWFAQLKQKANLVSAVEN